MNTTKRSKFILALSIATACAALLLATPAAFAASGTWNGITGNWSNTTTPGGVWAGGVPADGADNTANFTGVNITADRIITLDTARTIGNITFTDETTSSNNLTISGANILTLDRTSGVPIINVTQSGRTLTISSQIAGTVGLQKDGAGTLVLSNTNNLYTGGTVLNGGILSVTNNLNLGAAGTSNGITVTASSTFKNGTTNHNYARDVNIVGASTLLSTDTANGTTVISGNVSGAGSIGLLATTTNGNGLTLSGTNNTFEGQLRIAGANQGGGANQISVASLLDNTTAKGNIVFSVGNLFRGGFDAARFQYTGSTALTLANRQIEFTSTSATPFFGNILATTGAGALRVDTDLLVSTNVSQILSFNGGTIANTNTFAGKIVDNTDPLVGSVLVSNTGTTAPASGSTQITLGTIQGINVGDSISGAGIAPGTTITAINLNTRLVNLSNATTAAIPTNQSLTVAGAYNGTGLRTLGGAWTISGENTFTGNTIVASGVLTLGNSLALQYSALDTTSSILGTATTSGLRTNQTALTIGGLIGNKNFAATGGVFNSAVGAGYDAVTALTLNVGSGLTISGAGVTTSYSGIIANGAATGMTLTKTGAGTQALAALAGNTYTGATNVNAGTLLVQNTSGSGTGSGAVTVASGATHGTLGGTGIINASSITVTGDATPANNAVLMVGNTNGAVSGAVASKLTLGSSVSTTLGGMVQFDIFSRTQAANTQLLGNTDLLSFTSATPIIFGANAVIKANDLFPGELRLGTGTNALVLGDSWQLFAWNGVTPNITGLTFDLPSLVGTGFVWDVLNGNTAGFTSNGTIALELAAAPEPSRAVLMLFGAAGLLLRRRRKAA